MLSCLLCVLLHRLVHVLGCREELVGELEFDVEVDAGLVLVFLCVLGVTGREGEEEEDGEEGAGEEEQEEVGE